ncbi:MAG: phage distal tail protein [Candidatus Xenobia bacterium]
MPQRTFNGQTFGNGNPYTVASWDADFPRRITPVPAPRSDVSVAFDAGEGPGTIQATIKILDTSVANAQADLVALQAAFRGVYGKLYYQQSNKYWLAYCSDTHVTQDIKSLLRDYVLQVTWLASDPFYYYDTVPAAVEWGPYANPSTPGQTLAVTNPGGAYCYPVWTVNGPFKSPFTISTPLGNWTYNQDLGAGSVLVVDGTQKTVTLNGANGFSAFSGDAYYGGFFPLNPGTTNATLVGNTGNNTGNIQCTMTPRDPPGCF